MQGTARKGSELCAHMVDQGLAAAAMDCDGGDGSSSGLLWGRRHRRVRARGTRTRGRAQVTKLGARWRARHVRAQGSMFGMYGDVWPPSPLFIKPLDK